MHPVIKKNIILSLVVFVLAITLNISCIAYNPVYVFVLLGSILFVKKKGLMIHHKLILVSIFSMVSCLSTLIIDYIIYSNVFDYMFSGTFTQFQQESINISFSALTYLVFLSPLFAVRKWFDKLIYIIRNEKRNYPIFNEHPNLLCEKHYTRTELDAVFGYKSAECRIDTSCSKKKRLAIAKKLIGVIGKYKKPEIIEDDYYLTLWNKVKKDVVYGDYDVIEIRESHEIKDYDAVINKVIAYFYNEIDRYKPIGHVVVKVYGNPPISENTKRLLEKHFLKVKYN